MTTSIGERLKELRTEKGLTLAELSEKTNLSISYLSQIERDKTIPSLPSLITIAKFFNTGLRYFFESKGEDVYVVREKKGQAASRIDTQLLTPQDWSPKIIVNRIICHPHTSSEELEKYTGEEIIFVLSGKIIISIEEAQYKLKTGDSIHYDAMQSHSWKNESAEECSILWGRALSVSEQQI